MWLSDKGCIDLVEAVWASQDFDYSDSWVVRKIEKCGKELTRWCRENFGNVRRELETKRKLLAQEERDYPILGMNDQVRELRLETDNLHGKIESNVVLKI